MDALQASACAHVESWSMKTAEAEALTPFLDQAALPEVDEETAQAEARQRSRGQAGRASESHERPPSTAYVPRIPFDNPRLASVDAWRAAVRLDISAPSRSICSSPPFVGARPPCRDRVESHTPPSARARAPYWVLVLVERRKELRCQEAGAGTRCRGVC